MKKLPKIDATEVVHSLEIAEHYARVGENHSLGDKIADMIDEVKSMYLFDGSDNYYTITEPNNVVEALIKCDVWLKMTFIDFEMKEHIRLPKILPSCEGLDCLNGVR